jgi:threonine aldolase
VPIDLRSDTVTRPGRDMRAAMAGAEVGDDVYGEDPTVRQLEDEVADRFGRDAAMFTPSGVMATQTILATLCPRGTEVFCEADAHVVAYEAGAASILSGVQFRTIEGDAGRLDVQRVASALRPASFPYTELGAISVEETTNRGGGAIHGVDTLRALRRLADERGVPLHGDGARLFNAIVAGGGSERDYGQVFTAFSFCLSKGLGAPVGSVVVGDDEVVSEARLWRRRLGGAMRQVGILAAAGRYALRHHVERLADDHAHAQLIAGLLADAVPGSVDPATVATNMVYVDTGQRLAAEVVDEVRASGVLVGAMGPHLLRLVTHLDVDEAEVRRAAEVLAPALTG